MAEYRYYIATAGSPLTGWSEFYSSEETEATKSLWEEEQFSREELSELKIRKSRNTSLYSTLETWFGDSTKFSNEIGIEVYRGARSGADRYFKGFASVSDMKYNKERGWFSIVPRIDDNYREIIALADTEYDVKGEIDGQTVIYCESQTITTWTSDGARKYSAFDSFVADAGTNPTILTAVDGSAVEVQECYFIYGAAAVTEVYIFTVTNYHKNAGIDPWIDIVSVASNLSLSTGAVQITGNGQFCLTLDTAASNAYISIFSSTLADAICDFTMDIVYRRATAANVQDGAVWMDFIEQFISTSAFMNQTGFVGKVKSSFFNGDSIPTAGPATAYTYKGGTFLISETEMWCDAETDEFKISFNDLMSDVRETLQLYWHVDESGNFRVEHISWYERIFAQSTGVILTSSTYDKYRPFSDAEEFSFNKSKLASREQFSWPQVSGPGNFAGTDIIYNELETINNTVKHEPARVTTEIEYVSENVADASGDGYLFLDCSAQCTYYELQSEAGLYVPYTQTLVNNHFSWGNLHPKYWMWNRSSVSGSMIGVATTFNSAVRFMEASAKFGYQSTLDIFERIITDEGDGFQIETTRNLDTDFLTIKLGYDPYA